MDIKENPKGSHFAAAGIVRPKRWNWKKTHAVWARKKKRAIKQRDKYRKKKWIIKEPTAAEKLEIEKEVLDIGILPIKKETRGRKKVVKEKEPEPIEDTTVKKIGRKIKKFDDEEEVNKKLYSVNSLSDLRKIDITNFTEIQKQKYKYILEQLTYRKRDYPILDFKLQDYQEEFIEKATIKRSDWTFKNKFIAFIGWNWSWKTITCAYLVNRYALWDNINRELKLPVLSVNPTQILIVTKTSDTIKSNLEPLFLGTNTLNDKLKIPPVYIKKTHKDNWILKEIELTNWTKLLFRTYDAWQARLEWSSPDIIWLDELPEREDIFTELIRWSRNSKSQFIFSFTPTKFNEAVFNFFLEQKNDKILERLFVYKVISTKNKFADHTWLDGLSDEEKIVRLYWDYLPNTGLIYKEFNPSLHCIPYIPPVKANIEKYYCAVDLWVEHPIAFLFIGVDPDGNIYIFDEIYESNLLLWDLVIKVKNKLREYNITPEYIIADSAAKRERIELKNLWLNTVPADKRSKGETWLSNVKTGILKIKELFKNNKIIIADNCKWILRELRLYTYEASNKDRPKKENDDALDALRYFIFFYLGDSKINKLKREAENRIKKFRKLEKEIENNMDSY